MNLEPDRSCNRSLRHHSATMNAGTGARFNNPIRLPDRIFVMFDDEEYYPAPVSVSA